MKYQEIRAEKENRLSSLLAECKVFFAFSTQQFDENKTPLQEGEKYVSIGGGGYMPKSKVETFKKGLADLDTWCSGELEKYKLQDEHIKYELYNHECFYMGDPQTVCDLLPMYDHARILKVYQSERKLQKP